MYCEPFVFGFFATLNSLSTTRTYTKLPSNCTKLRNFMSYLRIWADVVNRHVLQARHKSERTLRFDTEHAGYAWTANIDIEDTNLQITHKKRCLRLESQHTFGEQVLPCPFKSVIASPFRQFTLPRTELQSARALQSKRLQLYSFSLHFTCTSVDIRIYESSI